MKTLAKPIIVTQTFNVSAKTVWEALTDVTQMRKWYFENIPNFKPEVGFKTSFLVTSDTRNFLHQWEITEVVVLKKNSYRWNYKDYSGDSFVHFELFTNKKETLLRLTTEVIADFPDNIPEFEPESCRAGWNYFIKDRLKNYIETSNK